ncbi:signal transducer and activator of transcription 5B-like isoform X2 [Biomphalaria glabrata]|uniref:Signal transducer and activator of transcription 5B-like isoform X2 n=1 Tax=Biomphalaria glabrata TaxID=6526 RepID=A0A9W3BBP4_BIOGL|nr:signal transducer and activator of transcription 5B-like isoform X2 [Biomphalaria glabrata]
METDTKIKKEKELIKTLTLLNYEGTQTLYKKIPFFFRSRMSHLIEDINWEDIKNGCERNHPNAYIEATTAFNTIRAEIVKYLDIGKLCHKDVGTDNLMLMKTDLNSILNNYGSDPVSFVIAMAECIRKEEELIANYEDTEMEEHGSNTPQREQEAEILSDDTASIRDLIDILKESIGEESRASQEETQIQILGYFELLISAMNDYLPQLKTKVDEWRKSEARASVEVEKFSKLSKVEKSFNDFSALLSDVLNWFEPGKALHSFRLKKILETASIQQRLNTILRALFQCNCIVYKQPKDLLSIENVGTAAASKKNKEDKTKVKQYRTKKKNNFETGVKFLGGKYFELQVDKSKALLYLVAEKDLAEGVDGNRDALGYNVDLITDQDDPGVLFKEVSITCFSRVETNMVYKQFFRLKYTLPFTVNGFSFDVTTLSLPFLFNTGSNQLLELIGGRMWYCANFDLYNGKFVCEDNLDVDIVLQMLNDRVANLNPQCPRILQKDELEFLKSRLPNSNSGRITMHGFIKGKIKKTRNEGELDFSFHTWFYAVLNSIKSPHLLKPWSDGIIYGFCSETMAKQVLATQPSGTFLIRPSISQNITAMSSRDACADMTLDIKLKKDNPDPMEDPCIVQSVPLFMTSVTKYTLFGAIAGIKQGTQSVAINCWTRKGRLNISHLRKYKPAKPEDESKTKFVIDDYKLVMTKTEQLKIEPRKDHDSESAKVEEAEAPLRKRPHPNSVTNSVSAPCVQLFQPPQIATQLNPININNQTLSGSQPYTLFHNSTAPVNGQPAFFDDKTNQMQQLAGNSVIEVDISQINRLLQEATEFNPTDLVYFTQDTQNQALNEDLFLSGTEHSQNETLNFLNSESMIPNSGPPQRIMRTDSNFSYSNSNFSDNSPPGSHGSFYSLADSGIDRDHSDHSPSPSQ